MSAREWFRDRVREVFGASDPEPDLPPWPITPAEAEAAREAIERCDFAMWEIDFLKFERPYDHEKDGL